LLLKNSREGTAIQKVSDIVEIKAIIDAGLTVADAVIPYTKPEDIEKLSLLSF
jgi:hypothetical protein